MASRSFSALAPPCKTECLHIVGTCLYIMLFDKSPMLTYIAHEQQ
jgi:hypothetical protein